MKRWERGTGESSVRRELVGGRNGVISRVGTRVESV